MPPISASNSNLENTLNFWAKSPSESETERCANAERVVCDALNNDPALVRKDIQVFTQGSYKNNTYIKLDSDVDIGIIFKDTFFADYPEGQTHGDFGNSDSDFTYKEFKNMVGKALVHHFGQDQVKRGNKAFDIHANSYRVDADVVPVFEHRRYTGRKDSYGNFIYYKGVEFRPDNGGRIINWPDQIYENSVAKNNSTSRKYKPIVRLIKNLRGKMDDDGIKVASGVESFLIASMVWNVPNLAFGFNTYTQIVREVLVFLFNKTMKFEYCKEWGEVNDLKYLFRDNVQPWTLSQAHTFIDAAWGYLGYK